MDRSTSDDPAAPRRGLRVLWGALGTAALLMVTSCGSTAMSLTEYAEHVEVEVTQMNARLDVLQTELDSQEPSIAATVAFLDGVALARAGFVSAVESLEPPSQAQRLHDDALAIVRRLRDATETLAAEVATFSGPGQLATLEATPEARALEAIDQEAIALCRAAESSIDATSGREDLSDVAWLPAELKEVVQVAFRCTYAERTDQNQDG